MVAYNFQKQFVEPIRSGEKSHTIRKNGKRRHAREGERLQLYCGQRSSQCFKIIEEDPICAGCYPLQIEVSDSEITKISVEFGGSWTPIEDIEAFAKADGFSGAEEMYKFWLSFHGLEPFEGSLIDWGGFSPVRFAKAVGFEPIETAPKDGTIVVLTCQSKPEFGEHVMAWSKSRNRWEGMHFGYIGSTPTYWDTEIEQPTHWRPAEELDHGV